MAFIIEKACSSCGQSYPLLVGFYSNSREWGDGRLATCIKCKTGYQQEQRDLKGHLEDAARKQRYHTDPEYRAAVLAKNAAYRKTAMGKRAMKRSRKTWAVTHPEEYRAIQRRWSLISNAKRRSKSTPQEIVNEQHGRRGQAQGFDRCARDAGQDHHATRET